MQHKNAILPQAERNTPRRAAPRAHSWAGFLKALRDMQKVMHGKVSVTFNTCRTQDMMKDGRVREDGLVHHQQQHSVEKLTAVPALRQEHTGKTGRKRGGG